MRLKIVSFGTDAEGIKLTGNPRNPEPDHARIAFPGGDVDVVRTSDGEYWVHIRVNREDGAAYDPFAETARICDGRIDLAKGYPTPEQAKAIEDGMIQHIAVRIGDRKAAKSA